jgi:hypothetical protein
MVFPIVGGNQSSGDLITNSLRFNSADSPELTKTFGSAGGDTWSYSCWLKRGDISEQGHGLLKANTNAGLYFLSTGALVINDDGASVHTSTRLFRDVGAWYHILFTGNGTTNKVYVNNVSVTFDNGTPNIGDINNNVAHSISKSAAGVEYMDGYLAEIHFVDGTEKSPTDFAETNDNGVWIPKEYTGSYGTNGFYLQFKQTGTSANASGIGADTSGNDNHFAVSNLAATDITTDTPQNNFCTLNPLAPINGGAPSTLPTFSEGNTQITVGDGTARFAVGTFATSMPYYFEVKVSAISASDSGQRIGILDEEAISSSTTYNSVYQGGGTITATGESNATGKDTLTANDIIGVAVDLGTNNNIKFYENGDLQATMSVGASYQGLNSTPFARLINATTTFQFNFGNAPFTISSGNADANGYGNFEYAVPSGYYALCTKNLAEYG